MWLPKEELTTGDLGSRSKDKKWKRNIEGKVRCDGREEKKNILTSLVVFTNLLNVKPELFPDIHLFFLECVLGSILPSQRKLRLVQLPKNKNAKESNM